MKQLILTYNNRANGFTLKQADRVIAEYTFLYDMLKYIESEYPEADILITPVVIFEIKRIFTEMEDVKGVIANCLGLDQ